MKSLSSFFAILLVSSLGLAADLPQKDDVASYLQEISVTIKAGNAQGSGTLMIVPVDGKPVTFCWTAAHVVAGLRSQKEVVTPDGQTRHSVTFSDPEIVQEEIEDGSRVGERKMLAKVLLYSEKEDLAILRVRKKGFARVSVVFSPLKTAPKVGTELYHCGSPGGQEVGANSVTPGIVAQVGRVFPDRIGEFDQVTTAALGGSSGGAVFLRDGHYVGMLTLGIQGADSFHYIVPIRRMRAWAEKQKVLWAMGEGKPPTEDELSKISVEDPGAKFTPEKKDSPTPAPPAPKLSQPVLKAPLVLPGLSIQTIR
jgi:S1-C subfamily serine protease